LPVSVVSTFWFHQISLKADLLKFSPDSQSFADILNLWILYSISFSILNYICQVGFLFGVLDHKDNLKFITGLFFLIPYFIFLDFLLLENELVFFVLFGVGIIGSLILMVAGLVKKFPLFCTFPFLNFFIYGMHMYIYIVNWYHQST